MDRATARVLVDYLAWADRRVLDRLRLVLPEHWDEPAPAGHGSLGGTVAHLIGTEWTWLCRLSGQSPRAVGPVRGLRRFTDAETLWPEVWAGWYRVVALREPLEQIDYHTTAGTPHQNSTGEILLHVSHHSAAYRGQIVILLRWLGYSPAGTDLIEYLRG